MSTPESTALNSPIGTGPAAHGQGRRTGLLVVGGAALAAVGLAAGLMLRPATSPQSLAENTATQASAAPLPQAITPASPTARAAQPLAARSSATTPAEASATTQMPPPRQRQATAPVAAQPAAERVSRQGSGETTQSRSSSADSTPWSEPARKVAVCTNCGVVEGVRAVQVPAQGSGLGAIAGGVVGGLLGNQVGGGSGRKAMTVLGAVGGGFAGNEIERRTRAETSYDVRVRMDDGTIRTLQQRTAPTPGARVRVDGDSLRSTSSRDEEPRYVRTGLGY